MRFNPKGDRTARTKKSLLKKRLKRLYAKWASSNICNVKYFTNKKNLK